MDVMAAADPARAAATAEAIERLRETQRRILALEGELGVVVDRLLAAGTIPWSGAAAEAWRDALAWRRLGIRSSRGELRDLHRDLGRLIDRLDS